MSSWGEDALLGAAAILDGLIKMGTFGLVDSTYTENVFAYFYHKEHPEYSEDEIKTALIEARTGKYQGPILDTVAQLLNPAASLSADLGVAAATLADKTGSAAKTVADWSGSLTLVLAIGALAYFTFPVWSKELKP